MNRWDGLDEFVAVAECGQFAAAGKRLGLSTSQVSRQVARLEERLQTRLFYRSTRRVALTEAGQTFLLHCRRLQDALNDYRHGRKVLAQVVDPFEEGVALQNLICVLYHLGQFGEARTLASQLANVRTRRPRRVPACFWARSSSATTASPSSMASAS